MDKINELKKKVRKICLYCKQPLTENEIKKRLKPFINHIDFHLRMKGQIVLWCDNCEEKIKKGELEPLGADLD